MRFQRLPTAVDVATDADSLKPHVEFGIAVTRVSGSTTDGRCLADPRR
jgi:hypothetical protein